MRRRRNSFAGFGLVIGVVIGFMSPLLLGINDEKGIVIGVIAALVAGVVLYLLGHVLDTAIDKGVDKLGDKLTDKFVQQNAQKNPLNQVSAPEPGQPGPVRSFCPQCGAAISPDDAFCGKCGVKLEEEVSG